MFQAKYITNKRTEDKISIKLSNVLDKISILNKSIIDLDINEKIFSGRYFEKFK